MTEHLLHEIWVNQLCEANWINTQGQKVAILNFGKVNSNFGPDIHSASILVNDNLLFGDIEIHWKGNDWYHHKHEKDPNYNNVILHVCWENGIDIRLENNNMVSSITLSDSIQTKTLRELEQILSIKEEKYCTHWIHTIPADTIKQTLKRNFFQYQYSKIWEYHQLWKHGYSIAHIRFIVLIRNLGTGINSTSWYNWALQFPFHQILNQDLDLKLLQSEIISCIEYDFQASYYQIPKLSLKKARARGKRSPKAILEEVFQLFNSRQTLHLFELDLPIQIESKSAYFKFHYQNNLVPFDLLFQAYLQGDQAPPARYYKLVESLSPEQNKYTRTSGIPLNTRNRLESKLITHQEKHFCSQLKCKECVIFKEWIKTN